MRTRLALPAVLLAALAAAAPAAAAPWSRVTTPDGASTDQVALLQNADGTTGVAWRRETTPTSEDLYFSKVRDGRLLSTTPVVQGWSTVANPGLVRAGGETRIFFGGLRTLDSEDPLRELNTAASGDGGTTWALQPTSVVDVGAQAYGGQVSAAIGPAGPVQTWAGTLGLFTHAGLAAAVPNVTLPWGQYANYPGLATDGGSLGLAWYSNAAGSLGVWAQTLAADGNAAGAPARMPGTADMNVGVIGRTPIVGVPGNGGYVTAYATGALTQNRIRVWRVGAGSAANVGRASGNSYVALAITADGRLWVAWTSRDSDGDPVVFARRSNPARSVWGATVAVGAPKGAGSVYGVDGDATPRGLLNLFANTSLGTASVTAAYATLVEPGLTLARTSGTLRRGETRTLKFKVTDAGDAVAGVKIRIGGKSDKTDRQGNAEIDVTGKGRRMTATAALNRYTDAVLRLRVRR